MKFTLTYDGPLPASANKSKTKKVWEIRKQLHPQLDDLWATHPALSGVETDSYYPVNGAVLIQGHHEYPSPLIAPFAPRIAPTGEPPGLIINLTEPIIKHGRMFRPVVRESFALHCGLKVLFLRKEAPGRVYQGGDVDGRIKTLLDALAMPQHAEQIVADGEPPTLINCLMEDDSMISSLEVETERLLTGDDHAKDYVRLIISVDVRVRVARIYNQSFLG